MDPITTQATIESGIKIFKELDKDQQNEVIRVLSLSPETQNALMLKGGEMTIDNANEFLSSFHQAMRDEKKSDALAAFAQKAGESFKSVAEAVSNTPFHIVGKTGNMALTGAKNTGNLFSSFFKGVGNLFLTGDDELQKRKIRQYEYEIQGEKKLQELKAIRGQGENFSIGLKFAALAVCILFITVLIVWIGANYDSYEEYDTTAGTKAVIFIGIMSLVLLMANAGSKKK